MQDVNGRPVCHRAEDLVTYLYGEASESDARDFRAHLQECDACRSEFAVFDQMHESIVVWRNEALGTSFTHAAVVAEPAVAATQFTRSERRLSAVEALREFFSVAPLWLRGATAFAGLLLCALLIFAVSRSWQKPIPVPNETAETRFTKADLDRAVAEAKMQVAREQQTNVRKAKRDSGSGTCAACYGGLLTPFQPPARQGSDSTGARTVVRRFTSGSRR
jgi:predicted anti-sigma-YlaC factor YlaD